MNKEQVLQIIEKRRQEDPKFRTRYDVFMAEKKAERLLTDSELYASLVLHKLPSSTPAAQLGKPLPL